MTKKSNLIVIAVATLIVFTGYGSALAAVNARANFSNSEVTTNTNNVEAVTSTKTQNYSLNFQKDLTRTISLNGDIRWTNRLVDNDGEETKTSSAYPVFTLSYRPPALYKVRMGYNRTESAPSEGDRITTANLHGGFSLPESSLPSVNLNYNRSTTEDDAAVQQLNTISTVVNLSSGYGFDYREVDARLNYTFGMSRNEDKVGETTTETPSHLFTLGLSRDFLDGKLKASTNFGYDLSETTTESLGSASRFEQTVGASQGLESEAPASPTLVTLVSESQLIDNDKSTAVVPSTDPSIDLSKSDWNIGLGFSGTRDIHALNLYVTSGLPTVTLETYSTASNWAFYTSTDGFNWTSVSLSLVSYNSVFSRIEFTFGEKSAQYFKVVNTSPATGVIDVTEIEGKGYALSTPMDSYTVTTIRDFSGVNLTYAPFKRLSLGMNFNLDTTTRESDDAASNEVKNSRYGMNGRYDVIPRYLIFSSTYSSIKSAPSDSDENETNSYTGTFSSTPIDTVTASVSYLATESLLGGAVQTEQNSINMSMFMALYTGIDLNMGATMSHTESPVQGSESDSTSRRWGLKLKPWKPLTIVLNGSSSSSETTQEGVTTDSTSKSLDMNISYTPSRKIYMSADFDLEPDSAQVYSLTWIPTRTIQCSVRYNSNEAGSGASTDLSWRPFKPISVHGGYSVTWVDNATSDQTEMLYTRASVRF